MRMLDRVFGNLYVTHPAEPTRRGALRWFCQCACGRLVIISESALLRGQSSCGCDQ